MNFRHMLGFESRGRHTHATQQTHISRGLKHRSPTRSLAVPEAASTDGPCDGRGPPTHPSSGSASNFPKSFPSIYLSVDFENLCIWAPVGWVFSSA